MAHVLWTNKARLGTNPPRSWGRTPRGLGGLKDHASLRPRHAYDKGVWGLGFRDLKCRGLGV